MGNVTIQESAIELTHERKGQIAIFMYVGSDDPVAELDKAVLQYVGQVGYNEFVDINMDNPWVRVIISGINEMSQVKFDPSKHRLNQI